MVPGFCLWCDSLWVGVSFKVPTITLPGAPRQAFDRIFCPLCYCATSIATSILRQIRGLKSGTLRCMLGQLMTSSRAMMGSGSQPNCRASDYREFPPPLALREHLLCLWTQHIHHSRTVYAHRVLPDACVDLVFIRGQAPAVVGPWTESFVAHLAPGTRITGARIYPGRASAILGLAASALLNQSVPLGDVWSAAARAPFAGIGDHPTLRASRCALESALLGHLRDVTPSDSAIAAAIHWLAQHPGGRIEQLSRFVGISSRQLQRRFSAAVGYGPKIFQSVLRFQRLLYFAGRNNGGRSLAHLSADAGYADQAHMNREMRRFAGKPPGVLLSSSACTLRLADFLAPAGSGESRGCPT